MPQTITIGQLIELAKINLRVSDLQDGEEKILAEEATPENLRTLYLLTLESAWRKEKEKETVDEHWLVTSGLQTRDQAIHEIYENVRRLSDAADEIVRFAHILGYEIRTTKEIEAYQLPQ
jgi:hypothetical protein